jgi:hypothetical protein
LGFYRKLTERDHPPILDDIGGVKSRGIHLPMSPTLSNLRLVQAHGTPYLVRQLQQDLGAGLDERIPKDMEGRVLGSPESLDQRRNLGKNLAGILQIFAHL